MENNVKIVRQYYPCPFISISEYGMPHNPNCEMCDGFCIVTKGFLCDSAGSECCNQCPYLKECGKTGYITPNQKKDKS
jgi:hypothetical protein